MVEIQLVNQDHLSCTSACVAMLAGITLEEAKALAPTTIPMSTRETFHVLASLGFLTYREPYSEVYRGEIYLATVPSLNIEKALHSVVIDARGEDIIIIDPLNGVEGKKFYDFKLGTDVAWADLIRIENFEAWRKSHAKLKQLRKTVEKPACFSRFDCGRQSMCEHGKECLELF